MPALCVYATGSVLPIFMYSLARAPQMYALGARNEASGFAVVVLVHSLGGLAGTPAMAAIWVKGLNVGSTALGLPFYISAAAYLVTLVILWQIRQ